MANARAALGPMIGIALAMGLTAGCGDDEETTERPELTGSVCEMPEDCYPDLDTEMLSGEVRCLTRVREGYCTHLCTDDEDCCAVEGECQTDLRQVCSPFESTGENVCFLSCEEADVQDAADGGVLDEQEFCQREAGMDFACRSTGGGAENRKVCVPEACGVGAGCATDEHCDPELTCATGFDGGYCTVPDCTADADCPGGSVCVTDPDEGNLCMVTCTTEADCSFCREPDLASACVDDVTFVEATDVSVCDPPR